MSDEQPIKPSRRQVLQGGFAFLASSILPGMDLFSAPPAAQTAMKHIYIAPDDHTDYLWTADDVTYRQVFQETIDYYLNLADLTSGSDPNVQSRWNCDGSLWMWEYEKNKPLADFENLIEWIRSGHISVPLNSLVLCLGGTPAEAVIRGMYYPGQIERRYNLRFPLVYAMENQTLPYGLISLWAGSGGKYSWRGICNCATAVADAGDREHDIYWWVGPDGSRILMKWNTLWQGNRHMGGYAEARDPDAIIEFVTTDQDFIDRYPYPVIGAFGKGWDNLQTMTDEFVQVAIAEQNSTTRRVRVSNELDFFEEFESRFGNIIPSFAGSFGNEWELNYVSVAELSARVKRAVEKLRSAEALATLISLIDPTFMEGREAARDLAFINMGLYYEHGWTGDGNVSSDERLAWARRIVGEIEDYVNTLYDDGVSALGELIGNDTTNTRFYAFNPLSWTRTDYADLPYNGPVPIHVVDCQTGIETPSQLVNLNGQQYLRILARDVPSVGYKVYEIRSGALGSFSDAATVTGNVIENDFYWITMENRGAISSILDKLRGNREFVREINNLVANDLGGTGDGTLSIENAGQVSVTLMASGSTPLNHESRITLFRDINRIEIRNEITENFVATQEWAFGFNLSQPDVWHEEVGAIIRARLLSNGGHYATRQARYDWLTLNHFADMIGAGGVGVTLSNADCYFMRLGDSTSQLLDTTSPQITVLIGGRVNGSTYGNPNQGSDTNFLQRFALQTHGAFNQVNAMKFALEHQNPLVSGLVPPQTPAVYPDKMYSLLTIDNPNVLLWALKPADDGIANGIVPRVWNVANAAANFSLNVNGLTLSSAQVLTHIETPIQAANVVANGFMSSIRRNQMMTFLMTPGPFVPTTPVAAAASPALDIVDPVITKSVFPPFAIPGEAVTWTIGVVNSGNLAVNGVRVSDTIPDEVQIVAVEASSGTISFSGQNVTFLQNVLAPGESVTLMIQGWVRDNTTTPFVITNTASMVTDEDINPRQAQATLVSATSLPQTGESLWDNLRKLFSQSAAQP